MSDQPPKPRGPKRKKPLRADPEKVRAFIQRGRENSSFGREGEKSRRARNAAPLSRGETLTGRIANEMRAGAMPGTHRPILQRSEPLKRKKRRRKVVIPKGVRAEAFARSRGICIVSLWLNPEAWSMSDAALQLMLRRGQLDRAVQLHHVFPESKFPHLAKVADNLVGVSVGAHDNHERAHKRIPRAALPDCTLRLAEREGREHVSYLERTYPA